MGQRVSSEDPSVETIRGRLEPTGPTSRPQIRLPSAARSHLDPGVVRVVLDGRHTHAEVRATDDGPVIRGAYDNARLARTPGEGENRLPGWVQGAGLAVGRSVLLDVVVPGSLYGARAPGTTAVYDAIEPPRSSLSRIADGLDE